MRSACSARACLHRTSAAAMQRLLYVYGRRSGPLQARPPLLLQHVFSSKATPKDSTNNIGDIATFESSESSSSAFHMTPMDRLTRLKPMITVDNDTNDDDSVDNGNSEEDDPFEGRPHDPREKLYTDWDEESEPDPKLLLGKKLLQLGRVYYRHIEPLPLWLETQLKEVTGFRTIAQIRRCLKDWMIQTDRESQSIFRNKELNWYKRITPDKEQKAAQRVLAYGPEETVAYTHYFMPGRFNVTKRVLSEVKTLLPDFRPKRVLDFGCGPATAGAAAVHVWGDDVLKYSGIDISTSMLDAAKIVMDGASGAPVPRLGFGEREQVRSKAFDYKSLGGGGGSEALTKYRSGSSGGGGSSSSSGPTLRGPSVVLWNKSGDVMKRALSNGDRYDLIVASYTLSEMTNDPSRRAAVQMLYELLDVNGCILILESGNPQGSHTVRTARQFILDHFNENSNSRKDRKLFHKEVAKRDKYTPKLATDKKGGSGIINVDDVDLDGDLYGEDAIDWKGAPVSPIEPLQLMLPPPRGYRPQDMNASVVAPCTHDGLCPLKNGAWCNFSQRVHSGVIRKSSEELFSYVIVQKIHDMRRPDSRKDEPGYDNNNWLLQYSNTHQKAEDLQPTPADVLQQFLKTKDVPRLVDQLLDQVDWHEYEPPLYRDEFGRVLRSPIKRKGHMSMDLCTPHGIVERAVIAKSDVKRVPSLYTALRKTTYGGLFPYIMNEGYTTHRRLSPFGGGHEEQALLQERARRDQSLLQGQQQDSKFARPVKIPDILATLGVAAKPKGSIATATAAAADGERASVRQLGRASARRESAMDYHRRRRASKKDR